MATYEVPYGQIQEWIDKHYKFIRKQFLGYRRLKLKEGNIYYKIINVVVITHRGVRFPFVFFLIEMASRLDNLEAPIIKDLEKQLLQYYNIGTDVEIFTEKKYWASRISFYTSKENQFCWPTGFPIYDKKLFGSSHRQQSTGFDQKIHHEFKAKKAASMV
jgi:hypothetical protein